MFSFRFLTLMFLIIMPPAKMFHMKRNFNFQTKDNDFFLSMFQKNQKQPTYDISHWVNKLHLQHCVFVEIGEGFCAVFAELKNTPEKSDNPRIDEFFLGICDCETLRSWKLCSSELLKIRKSDCIFTEATITANTNARVHRRLCDIKFLKSLVPICKCSQSLAGQKLYQTQGFPTCFLDPLPNSICFPRGICGVAECTVKTIMGIYSPQCDPNCHQKQPFCEELGPWTSLAPKITSSWTSWSVPKCNVSCGRGFLVSKAFCENNNIDCIGPGPFCCSNTTESCECKVVIENGIMKANRFTKPCTRSVSCPIVLRRRSFLPENQFRESEGDGIDDYKEFEQEKVHEPLILSRRRLLGNLHYDMDNYEIMNENDDEEFYNKENDNQIAAIGDEIDDDDMDYDSNTENATDNSPENNEDEEEEENDGNAMGTSTKESNDYETIYEDKSSDSSVKSRISFLVLTHLVILKNFFPIFWSV